MKANLPQLLVYRAQPHLNHITEGLMSVLLVAVSISGSLAFAAPVQHITQQPAEYVNQATDIELRDFEKADPKIAKSSAAEAAPADGYGGEKVSLPKGFALIKACESGGNYRAINPAGYYGAYQFSIGTWNSTARASGRNDLVGVRPDKASQRDQDAMAKKLYSLRGWQPWGCAYRVGLL